MTTPEHSQSIEHPNTYVVQNVQNQQELTRLMVQDQLITSGMGGVWPEQTERGRFQSVLDIGCGSGGWIVEAARNHPETEFVGVDINDRMVAYAHEQAVQAQVERRVRFQAMDALRMLEFRAASFDLVNVRFGMSYLRTWDWPKLLSECRRVVCTEGVVRLTESQNLHKSPSAALTQFYQMIQSTMFRAGHLFKEEPDGLTSHLVPLLSQHVSPHVQMKAQSLTFHAGTPQGEAYYEDMRHGMSVIRPFLQKWGCLAQDYDAICRQALSDIQQPGFHVTWDLVTAWATIP